MALLNEEGKVPSLKDLLAMLRMTGDSSSDATFTHSVGTGSRSHVLLALRLIKRFVSSMERGSNNVRGS